MFKLIYKGKLFSADSGYKLEVFILGGNPVTVVDSSSQELKESSI